MNLCPNCTTRPIAIKKAQLCRLCYLKQWNASGGGRAALERKAQRMRMELRRIEVKLAGWVKDDTPARKSPRQVQRDARSEKATIALGMLQEGKTLRSIGIHFGVTHEAVRQWLLKEGVTIKDVKPKTRRKLSPEERKVRSRAKSEDRIIAQMDKFVKRGGPDECWPWLGRLQQVPKCREGYCLPKIRAFDPLDADRVRHTTAYRIAYMLHHGPIPNGMTVDHVCFNPACCNPAHLRLLTLSENSARKDPNREWRGVRSSLRTHCGKCGTELYATPSGLKYCRPCVAEASKRYYMKKKQLIKTDAPAEAEATNRENDTNPVGSSESTQEEE